MLIAGSIAIGVVVAIVHGVANLMFSLSYAMSGPELHGMISSVLNIPFPLNKSFHPWILLVINAIAWGLVATFTSHFVMKRFVLKPNDYHKE